VEYFNVSDQSGRIKTGHDESDRFVSEEIALVMKRSDLVGVGMVISKGISDMIREDLLDGIHDGIVISIHETCKMISDKAIEITKNVERIQEGK